jgi:hypothetical protein
MKWEALIIPLIGLGVWILSTIFRGREEQQQQERTRRPRAEGSGQRPSRRPATDLDRFLEEARARRKTESKPVEQERPAPVILEALPAERLPERPQRSPERRPKPRTAAATAPVARPVEPPLAQPVALVAPPVVEHLSAPPVAAAPAPLPEMRVPTQNPEGTPVRAVVKVPPTQPRRPSPAALKLMEMLKDKQSLMTAMMLREVFDRPLCQRRRK